MYVKCLRATALTVLSLFLSVRYVYVHAWCSQRSVGHACEQYVLVGVKGREVRVLVVFWFVTLQRFHVLVHMYHPVDGAHKIPQVI